MTVKTMGMAGGDWSISKKKWSQYSWDRKA